VRDNRNEDEGASGVPRPPNLEHLDQLPRENGRGKGPPEQDDFLVQAPTVSLPKGGGAIQGISESFQANPVTGTGSLSIPVALTQGRGLTPQLQLSYDSGAGNGPFGHGWSMGIASIRRKTDRGLPRYADPRRIRGTECDVFVLAGSEDLVPRLDAFGELVTRSETDHEVQYFRPRIEGSFTRVERWRRYDNGDVHWRTRDASNVLRKYGESVSARVVDPDDATRTFEWLLEEVSDEVGNVVRYEYKAENRAGVPPSPAELSRTLAGNQCTYRYPKAVRYGNRTPGSATAFHVHVVFDYGEHDAVDPQLVPADPDAWSVRSDPHSSFRSGFDIRCYRLCRRILVFHQFPELDADNPVLVRSTVLSYDEQPHLTKLLGVHHEGHRDTFTGSPETIATPQVGFTYQTAQLGDTVELVQGLDDVGGSFEVGAWQWVDLDGEGLSGLLTEQAGAWYYKRNEGQGALGAVQRLGQRPQLGLGGLQLLDLGGDGKLDLVSFRPPTAGFYERGPDGQWGSFRDFRSVPSIDTSDPNVRMVDLDGDGHADLLVTEDEVFRWYPSKAKDGFDASRTAPKARDEELGPALVFENEGESIFLADMTGDGLTDLVRVRAGAVCYWPNRGYGRFGAKVVMASPPVFDHPDRFDPRRLRFADLDGSGPTDLVYVGPDAVRLWFNASGNGFGAEQVVERMPGVHDAATVQVADLRGDGTACLVWSSPLLGDQAQPLRYLRLMAGGKPHLLSQIDNGMGRVTTLTYAPSTKFYLADRRAGRPWATRLHFPVQVLEKVEVVDRFSGWRFANTYTYHHGFYDGVEREFRGFGMVEQRDTESIADFDGAPSQIAHHVDPVVTRTWFHTGAWSTHTDLQATYAAEGFQGDVSAPVLAPSSLPAGLDPESQREATRALRGQMVRQEVYAEDAVAPDTPYVVTTTRYEVVQVQPRGDNRHGVYLRVPAETRSASYERTDDDPRVGHELVLLTDDYGQVLRSATVAYPRRVAAFPEQDELHIVITDRTLRHDDLDRDQLHLSLPIEARVWELTQHGLVKSDTAPFTVSELDQLFVGSVERAFEAPPDTIPDGQGVYPIERRKLTETRTVYFAEGGQAPFTKAEMDPLRAGESDQHDASDYDFPSRRLVYETYQLAFPDTLLANTSWGGQVTTAQLQEGGYVQLDGAHGWRPSGRPVLDTAGFFQPLEIVDPFGQRTTVDWHASRLFPVKLTTALGHETEAVTDLQALATIQITEPNGHTQQVALDALGRPTKTWVASGDGTEGDTAAEPTTTLTYVWPTATVPGHVRTERREEHRTAPGPATWQEQVAYADGGGNVVLQKGKAWPEPGVGTDRWIGTGRTLLNNKGLPVRQYEPFFTDTDDYEDEDTVRQVGVSPLLHYDPVGRQIRVDHPDGTVEQVVYDGWAQASHDRIDTVAGSAWEAARTGSPDPGEQRGLAASQAHAGTPTLVDYDVQGRPFRTAETFEVPASGPLVYHATVVAYDVQGNARAVTDARGVVTQADQIDAMGRPIHSDSPDAGETWVLLDVGGQPVRTWRSGGLTVRRTYDALRRPTGVWVTEGADPERLAEAVFYGDFLAASATPGDQAQAATSNLLGRPWRTYDEAGLVEVDGYDFEGNVVSTTRTFLDDVDVQTDWQGLVDPATPPVTRAALDAAGGPDLSSDVFTTSQTYDALGRVTSQTTPDGSVTRPRYNAGGLLEGVDVEVVDDGLGSARPFVASIDYNARGQRTAIAYSDDGGGGGAFTTTYDYDAQTFRLTRLRTVRASDSAVLQDWRYAYDAAGNLVRIDDDSQSGVYYDNAMASALKLYAYDATYRLVGAQGRERASMTQTTHAEPAMGALPEDPAEVHTYYQAYSYDAVGNLLEVKHHWGTESSPGAPQWTRTYAYEEDGGGNPVSNQLQSTTFGGTPESYNHDARGAMTSMPHLSYGMTRNWRDQLRQVVLDAGGTEDAVYHYDAAGQRVRKVVRKTGATEERFYLGGYELYRKTGAAPETIRTLHVMDGQRRIALVETVTSVTTPTPVFRFQLGNHLDSVAAEVDEDGQLLTYEEYHPYGTAAWRASAGATVLPKRYRYTGMERDEETGLALHGVRLYAPWLGRWCSADPIGLGGGVNRFAYASQYPVSRTDREGTNDKDEYRRLRRAEIERLRKLDEPDGPTPNIFTLIFGEEVGKKADWGQYTAGISQLSRGVIGFLSIRQDVRPRWTR